MMTSSFRGLNADTGISAADSSRFEPIPASPPVSDAITGRSKRASALRSNIEKLSSVVFPILIQGETGSGKDVVARALHNSGSFRKEPFIAINCGAMTDTLIVSELFGHMKGAFTGAVSNKAGVFSSVGAGTLFLDEIETAPPFLQSTILRVVETREFLPVGASRPVKFAGRLITASNVDLLDQIRRGSFRKDLYYRLSAFNIFVPPLRSRKEDIPDLVYTILATCTAQSGLRRRFTGDAMNTLCNYNWPGNVRELQNVIMRCILEAGEELVDSGIVREFIHPEKGFSGNQEAESVFNLYDVQKSAILRALNVCRYNKAKTAKLLGISRSTLYSLLEKHGICISASPPQLISP